MPLSFLLVCPKVKAADCNHNLDWSLHFSSLCLVHTCPFLSLVCVLLVFAGLATQRWHCRAWLWCARVGNHEGLAYSTAAVHCPSCWSCNSYQWSPANHKCAWARWTITSWGGGGSRFPKAATWQGCWNRGAILWRRLTVPPSHTTYSLCFVCFCCLICYTWYVGDAIWYVTCTQSDMLSEMLGMLPVMID